MYPAIFRIASTHRVPKSLEPRGVRLLRGTERRRHWTTALFAALMAFPAAASCGAREVDMSTKTGNPPVIDQTRVRIVGAVGEVIVRGERGAVETADGVQVVAKATNRSNDASASAIVNEDGSFEVRVAGTLEDEYELTITARGTSASTTLSLATSDTTDPTASAGLSNDTRGSTTTDVAESGDGALTCLERTGTPVREGGTRGPQPICGMLQSEALCQAAELVASVSLECADEQDCTFARRIPNCVQACGSVAVVSKEGAVDLAAGLSSIDETICRDFDGEGCTYLVTGCTPTSKAVALCEDGQCVARYVHSGFGCSDAVLYDNTPTCDDYETEALCQRDEMLADLNNACTRDDECTQFNAGPACAVEDCSHNRVVAVASLADVEASLAAIDDGICRQANDQTCEYQALPCLATALNPRCVAGACVHVPAE